MKTKLGRLPTQGLKAILLKQNPAAASGSRKKWVVEWRAISLAQQPTSTKLIDYLCYFKL